MNISWWFFPFHRDEKVKVVAFITWLLPWGSSWADALRHLEKVDDLDDLDVVALNSLMVMLQKGGRKKW